MSEKKSGLFDSRQKSFDEKIAKAMLKKNIEPATKGAPHIGEQSDYHQMSDHVPDEVENDQDNNQ